MKASNIHVYNTNKYSPRFIFAWSSAGENETGRIPMTVPGRIQDRVKLFACVEGRTLPGAKITLHTVYTYTKGSFFTS